MSGAAFFMAKETFGDSLWSSLTPAPAAGVDAGELQGDVVADVAIVGGGILGLSSALHLAEAGVRVAVAEAEEVGFGASGRNTGFVVPSLRNSLAPSDLRDRLGSAGDRLMKLVGRSGAIVFDVIERHAIACSAERTGWMQPAHSAAMLDVLKLRQADWRAVGKRVDILSAEETERRVGAAGYHGALFDPSGGQLNPLAYARGLAAAAAGLGVAVHARTRVRRIEREGGRWVVATGRGRILAERVLLATNALVGPLCPPVAAGIVPARVWQIATQPLAPELRSRIIPERAPVADTRRHTLAVRWSPDGRLITGGLVLPGPGGRSRATRTFLRRLDYLYPQYGPFRAEHVWNGVIAATMDSLPRFLSLAPGLDAAIGCNGRGIALTTALGCEIAGLYAGALDLNRFPLLHTAPERVPGGRLGAVGPSLWLPWSNMRDNWEARGRG